MALIGFIVALCLFKHFMRQYRGYARRIGQDDSPWGCGASSKHHTKWERDWTRDWERHKRRAEREARRWARRYGYPTPETAQTAPPPPPPPKTELTDEEILRRARVRAGHEVAFYAHLQSYLAVIAFLALINVFTSWYPWFLWPALGWGIGLVAHYMAVFGSRRLKERYFDPAVAREVQREKAVFQTEKQADLSELTSTIAHEIRNPIAAAKSLVQQMGEDPGSVEHVEYAKVAIDELDRVERRISHLLKYAKEEDYAFQHVNLATIVDASLTQMKSKLEGAKVAAVRHYITGPTVNADPEKLKSVFVNIIDNAIDSFANVAEGRRIECSLENGGRNATVRIRDNGAGISKERLDRIFNPFFTTKDHGTGLGMAIAKKIVEAHTGTIEVESAVGRGTEFQVTLPLPTK
ncbi:MAG TPA: HAMP domain-containing sensor histidine kinase [Candidatus Eisenbacteria bacterium]|nr:HAMP domain-containing sensor histidine kinase [Candidatus Eisenbacteria bacterium]